MLVKEHLLIMIDGLEYYITKEIEKNIYGTGDTCYVILYDRLLICLKSRKEIDYKPYHNVEELLEYHGYDKDFINKFMARSHCCKSDEYIDGKIISIKEQLVIMIDILEYYLTKKIENNMYGSEDKYYPAYYMRLAECIEARKDIDYKPYQSVEALMEDHGYNSEFIDKFISRTNYYIQNRTDLPK